MNAYAETAVREKPLGNTPPGKLPKSQGPQGVGAALTLLLERSEGRKSVSLADALQAFGTRSFGPVMLVPALLLTLPTGALPGVPLVLGAVIAVAAMQLLFGLRRPHVPGVLARICIPRKLLQKTCETSSRLIEFIDAHTRPRMAFMLKPPVLQVLAVAAIALCILLVPVEIIPFATAVPGFALIVIGLAMTMNDGLLALVSLVATLLAGVGVWMLLG
jgi:hypothetical protein